MKPNPEDYGAEIRHDGTIHWPEDADFSGFCFACEELGHGCDEGKMNVHSKKEILGGWPFKTWTQGYALGLINGIMIAGLIYVGLAVSSCFRGVK